MDTLHLNDVNVDAAIRAARQQLNMQREYMGQIKKAVDLLSSEWRGAANEAYRLNLNELGRQAGQYLTKIEGFLNDIEAYSREYANADRKGRASAKPIVVSPGYMRDAASKLNTANKALENAKRYLNNANSISTWTCPQRSEVVNRIKDSVKKLSNVQQSADKQIDNFKKTANMVDTVTSKVSGAETKLTRELGEGSGIKFSQLLSNALPIVSVAVFPPSFAVFAAMPNNIISNTLDSLRNGTFNLRGGN